MNLVGAFLRLIRFPNLFFIAVTQFLFYFCIVVPRIHEGHFQITEEFKLFLILVSSSLSIAAGGYVINDYFDLNIDQINKPSKMVVEKLIHRRWAIIWHWLFSTAGVVMSSYLSFVTHNWLIGLSNTFCVLLLWFYSTTFKKKLLVGNIIISLLTAWVVLVVYFFVDEYPATLLTNIEKPDELMLRKIFRLAFLYGGFAFIISLIREVVKDIEDMEGDSRYGCKTMPIVWCIPVAKVFTAVWLIVLIGAVGVVQFYALRLGWWISVIYGVTLIILPLIWIFRKLFTASVVSDFSKLSATIKLVMLTGILSMIFFKIYS
ncbi:MAG: ubiquinone biosynthesis protein UbiA [Bacteroidetes bacterium]|nr:MAG: ubiquinone biosynthesis protein UbiA [Bacteroidota bacterium]